MEELQVSLANSPTQSESSNEKKNQVMQKNYLCNPQNHEKFKNKTKESLLF